MSQSQTSKAMDAGVTLLAILTVTRVKTIGTKAATFSKKIQISPGSGRSPTTVKLRKEVKVSRIHKSLSNQKKKK